MKTETFALADDLLQITPEMSQPSDLPGRYGRVIRDLQRLLQATETLAVVAGGWAVWRYGYAGRVTQDVDIVVSQDKIESLQRSATLYGFDPLITPAGRWPKLIHRETSIDVDLLPESGIPGTPSRPAPVAIGHPMRYGAVAGPLQYISLPGLFELKLGASRAKDIADIVELVNVHREQLPELISYVKIVHVSYANKLAELAKQAAEES